MTEPIKNDDRAESGYARHDELIQVKASYWESRGVTYSVQHDGPNRRMRRRRAARKRRTKKGNR